MSPVTKILVVDDEPFNLDIMQDALQDAGFATVGALDGPTGLELLKTESGIALALLDRMMPGMSGIEVLKQIKADDAHKHIPVIMQTAAGSPEQVQEGIAAGAYYYLTKPYKIETLVGIVKAALADKVEKATIQEATRENKVAMGLLDVAFMRFRTLEEARNIAQFIASAFPQPDEVVYGLHELMINAVEHGNLGITYEEKSALMQAGEWQQEIENRLKSSIYADRYASIVFDRVGDEITIRIKDQGHGFDYSKYLELSPDRATDLHGRGIATARTMCFDTLEYQGKGNEVVVKKRI